MRMNATTAVSTTPSQVMQLSEKTERELSNMEASLRLYSVAQQVWDDILSPQERARLGNDLEGAWRAHLGTIGMLAAVWSCSYLEALLELCDEFGAFDPVTRRRWRRETGLENGLLRRPTRPPEPMKPHWDGQGTLTYAGETARTVRPGVATHLYAILDAFQQQNWPRRIADPLGGLHDSQRLREAVRTLNQRLKTLRFSCDGSGEGICWDLADHPRM